MTGTQTLTNKTLTSPTISGGTVSATQIDITAQGDLRLQDTTGGQYVALQAPGTVSTSWTATLPGAVGTSGQALRTSDGSGTLEWFTPETGDISGVTAGDGLTGGGTTGTVTLDVVGGTGITATANDIAIDSSVVTLDGSQTLTNKTLTSPTISGGTVSVTQVDITAQGDLRLQDTTGGEYVGFQAAGTTTTYTVTMPGATAASDGQALTITTSGTGSWSTVGDASVGTANEWTAQQNFNNTALTFDATQDWALTANQVATLTLTANTTFDAPTQMVDGSFYSLIINQDGTGGWTASWNGVFKWAAATAPTLTTTAAAKDIFVWRSDGTNMYEVGRQLNVS